MVGGEMSGNLVTASWFNPMIPKMTIIRDITVANTGRSIIFLTFFEFSKNDYKNYFEGFTLATTCAPSVRASILLTAILSPALTPVFTK